MEMTRYPGSLGQPKLDFTRSSEPLVRFGDSVDHPVLHLNRAAMEAMGEPRWVELFYHSPTRLIRVSRSEEKENALKVFKITKYFCGVSAIGFVTWSGVQWPEGETAEPEILDSDLVIKVPLITTN